jgi:Mce-associated membrane protein
MTAKRDSRTENVDERPCDAADDMDTIDAGGAVDDRPGHHKSGNLKSARQPRNGGITRWLRRPVMWRSMVLALLVIGAAGLAACVFFLQYRPYQQTNDTAGHDAIKAASDGTVALLSYSPDTLEHDFATAKAHLTGNFLAYYDRFTHQIVTPAAKQAHVQTTAAVVRAAVSELHPNSAVILTFINQTTISKDKPEPGLNPSAVRVGLTKVDGTWLISSFDPV